MPLKFRHFEEDPDRHGEHGEDPAPHPSAHRLHYHCYNTCCPCIDLHGGSLNPIGNIVGNNFI